MYGILLLTSILLYRNYFYASSGANTSLKHFTLVVIAAAVGYGAAAIAIPIVTRRLSKAACIAGLLGLGGVVTGVFGPTFGQPSFLVISLALGLVAQGVAICTVTIIQQRMDDSYRGRVFALYDMLFNVPFVIGAVVAAQIIPYNGKSYTLIAVAAIGYLAAAGMYAFASRHELRSGPSPASEPFPAAEPPPAEPPPAAASPGPPEGALPAGPAAPGSAGGSPSAQRRNS
jgi:predicted MFS family arabinose efflux permease